jgi:hypothetical protein
MIWVLLYCQTSLVAALCVRKEDSDVEERRRETSDSEERAQSGVKRSSSWSNMIPPKNIIIMFWGWGGPSSKWSHKNSSFLLSSHPMWKVNSFEPIFGFVPQMEILKK